MAFRAYIEDTHLFNLIKDETTTCVLRGSCGDLQEKTITIKIVDLKIIDVKDRISENNATLNISKGEVIKLMRTGSVLLDKFGNERTYMELEAFNENDWFKKE